MRQSDVGLWVQVVLVGIILVVLALPLFTISGVVGAKNRFGPFCSLTIGAARTDVSDHWITIGVYNRVSVGDTITLRGNVFMKWNVQ